MPLVAVSWAGCCKKVLEISINHISNQASRDSFGQRLFGYNGSNEN